MSDLILSFLQSNGAVDYSFVLPLVLIYIVLFWIIVSVWVYYDAKKRFPNKKTAVWIALGNFLFQVPFLILYILFRPVEDEDFDAIAQGGVNVPIVNFVGKEGVVMSLELKINQHAIKPENASEMKIDVSFDSSDQNKVLGTPVITVTEKPESKINNLLAGIKNLFAKKEGVNNSPVVEDKPKKKKKKNK